jgi:hypothetical protein
MSTATPWCCSSNTRSTRTTSRPHRPTCKTLSTRSSACASRSAATWPVNRQVPRPRRPGLTRPPTHRARVPQTAPPQPNLGPARRSPGSQRPRPPPKRTGRPRPRLAAAEQTAASAPRRRPCQLQRNRRLVGAERPLVGPAGTVPPLRQVRPRRRISHQVRPRVKTPGRSQVLTNLRTIRSSIHPFLTLIRMSASIRATSRPTMDCTASRPRDPWGEPRRHRLARHPRCTRVDRDFAALSAVSGRSTALGRRYVPIMASLVDGLMPASDRLAGDCPAIMGLVTRRAAERITKSDRQ